MLCTLVRDANGTEYLDVTQARGFALLSDVGFRFQRKVTVGRRSCNSARQWL